MKKIIMIFISILLLLFVSMCVMISFDNNYVKDLEEDVLNNTKLDNVTYINKYNGYYIVSDLDYVYLFNSEYEEIYRLELYLLYENKNSYDIVYRDNLMMYMDNYKNKEGIVFKYYDIYTYELVDEVVLGGN